MSEPFEYDVFLSHNHADKPRVRRLAERLQAAGLRVWFDEWIIQAGDIIALKVDEGLEQSRVLLLCVSPAALASNWVALERSTAVHRDPANAGRRFIPLLLGECNLPDTLRRYKYVDFREESEAAFAEVLVGCRPAAESLPSVPQTAVRKALLTENRKPLQPPPEAEPLAVLERRFTGHEAWVESVAISPDGRWFASGSEDKSVKLWDVATGVCRATLIGHTGLVRSVAITPDGKRILSGSFDGTLRVWDADSGRELARLDGHKARVWSVLALHDNACALSGGFDKTLKLWDIASGSCLKTINCGMDEADDISSSAVDRVGSLVLSGHRDGTIRLWNLASGDLLATLKSHPDAVYSVQFAPDERFAVSR